MGFFKRLCLFVFGLAGLLALAALVLPWFGPWTSEATALLGVDEYYIAVEALVLVTALGCLICLLRSIFKRNRKTVIVAKEGGDQITVTRDAIASQATHVIEEDGAYVAKRVSVWAKKRGHVRVAARVQPQMTVDTVVAGKDLHDRLVAGLTTVCGDNVDSVDLEFLNAAEYAPTSAPADDYALAASDLAAGSPSIVDYTAATVATDPSGDDSPAEASTATADAPAEAAATTEPEAAGDGADDASDETMPASASASAPAEGDAQSIDDAPEVEGSEITVPMARYAGRDSETTGEE
ncbi:alkaline shock response membrane anchor protein AmaP [Parafannyhessea umbonata]|uniref:alkaline shock response membrane anchor protein AmaP n=1 Tax=Parafannyhessea umbonata TaxID=604330 RepID=UPI002A82F982|nr:alkaline shock response membrane anchor protein AmaP [Parafannyhessea umbonata]MDY4418229.1 alkaline shock response membrane anchor protein AmaP [Parafannyhessea umbonata]